ncbi:MAG TPA: HEAT repeat domain-containing protein, partial [Candidatus Binatia bacterium]|nr:HEAT repeat domain-containing protein [Candidatus Binatia bacterium]
ARPDGSQLEPVMSGGMDNPVEVAFLPDGEPFFTTTFFVNPEAGRRDAIVHLVYGAVYPKINDVLDDLQRTGDLLPPLTHLGPAVPSGLMTYQSHAFGADFLLNLFSSQFNLHKIQRHALEPSGAGYRSRDIDFVVSDSTDFHPTDVLEDADGTLLVLDTGGWYKLCCPSSQMAKADVLGAIYRVRRSSVKSPEDPRGLKIKWKESSPAEIAKLLDDERSAVRERAIAELAKRGEKALEALSTSLTRDNSVERRRNALWALTRIESAKARELVREAFADPDASVKKAAIHSAGLNRDAAALSKLTGFLKANSTHLQRYAATALGRLEKKDPVPALLAAAPGPTDRILEHSMIYALIETGDAEAIRAGVKSHNPAAQRAALIALDQLRPCALKPADVIPHLSSRDTLLRDTSRWIASHHPDWGDELSGLLKNRLLNAFQLAAPEREELQRQLAEFARTPAIQDLLAYVAAAQRREVSSKVRVVALRAMGQTRLKEAPKGWAEALASCLASKNEQVTKESVATIRALSQPKGGLTNLNAQLLELAQDAKQPDEVRLDAIAAISGTAPKLDDSVVDFLIGAIDSSRSPIHRTTAANVLGRARLSNTQFEKLVNVLPTLGPMELSRVTAAFENASDESLGMKFVEALKKSPGLKGMRADMVKTRLAKFPPSVQQEGEQLMRVLNVDLAQQRARLDEFQGALVGGDHRRGQAIFNSTRAACVTCHAIGYLGGQVGPDLTRIGSVRTDRDLIESIVYPSASFARAYEPVIVETKDGEQHSGIVKREAADSVQLVEGAGVEQRFARSDITSMRPGTVSVMPEGLDQQLTQQELADLVAFLKSLK